MNFWYTESFLEQAYLRDVNYQVFNSEVAGNKDVELDLPFPRLLLVWQKMTVTALHGTKYHLWLILYEFFLSRVKQSF